ncbi:hypothetical protein P3T37_005564 [Kitasatospora sp. MAA4]|uniref:vanadium-dependent haloperoxidase n=1 Tax=Kitasatospora sp. MAA4 TaxID=3035093 RepID=UPI002474A127|nr:vanadium-dependent haloperoxidase [Kitasatospora sp. MAA4]MDH6136145.1 hypothetical protein [Kitasatospora sp. MAA4]
MAAAAALVALVGFGAPLAPVGAAYAATVTHDHVLDWNQVLRNSFKDVCGEYGAPGPLARAGAMMQGAIWDADNSVSGGGNPAYGFYLGRIPAAADANAETAIDYAAHDTLVAAFPGQPAAFYQPIDAALATELGYIPGSVSAQAIADGKAVGQQAAQAMITARSGDTPAFDTSYTVNAIPGQWRPTDTKWSAATPNWGKLKPFTMSSSTEFQPPLPAGYSSYAALLASPEYAANVNEVQRVGSADAEANGQRTPDQTQQAQFWANDRGPDCGPNQDTLITPGTYKPPGQLFETTAAISQARGLGEFANARLFALVGFGMADAGITAWDAKYDTPIQLWRPVTAIQNADPAGNPALTPDPNWEPLSLGADGTHFTPPFPSYVSGHATFAGAWAGVVRDYFGDNVNFTAHTQDPQLSDTVTRSFTSVTAAAVDDGFSRLYLGVHYRWDTEQGLNAGYSVGDNAYRSALKAGSPIAYQGTVATAAAAASGTSLTLPVAHPVRAGDTLLVSVMLTNTKSGTVTATDSQGNVYTAVAPSDRTDGAGDRTLVLTSVGAKPLSSSDTITLTYPSSGEHHVSVQEFSGVTAVDQSTSATGAAGTPFNSGATATTSAAGELVFGVAGVQGGENATWTGDFTPQPTLFVSEDQLATAYQIVSTPGSYAATGSATHQWMSAVVTLR